jgi:CheY-like chemotaxis protein
MKQFLVADDSADHRARVCSLVRDQGHESLEAVDGLQALKLFEHEHPDCVIAKFAMPTLGGAELVAAMHHRGPGVPVIVVTEDERESTRQQCLEAGADAVLYQPLEFESLRYMLAEANRLEW